MSTLIWCSLPFLSGPGEEAVQAAEVGIQAEAVAHLSAEAVEGAPAARVVAAVEVQVERAVVAAAAQAALAGAVDQAAVLRPHAVRPEIPIAIPSIRSHA